MLLPSRPQRRQASGVLVSVLLCVAGIAAGSAAAPDAAIAESATSTPLAVVVVGPAGSKTADHVREGRKVAAQLRSLGAQVREIYSPNATWSRVAKDARGANLFVYLGQGRGHPGPYGAFDSRSMNGLGLNRTPGSGHRNARHYGEYFLRASLRLKPGAVVILSRVPYAAGSSELSGAYTTRLTAARRADNYAAGFLRAGAAAVLASDHSVASMVTDLFGAKRSMQGIFWRSPWTSSRYDSAFTSSRTSGARGILAPYGPGRYYQSVVGRLSWTTTDWQHTWNATAPPADASSVRVTSISALLDALANNAVTEIVVADGTYRVSAAASKRSNSLWIGAEYATRTRPILVRAETTGGVVITSDGSSFGAISFQEGAHHQTWQGFRFTVGKPVESGIIMFGGYANLVGAHHIALRDVTVDNVGDAANPRGHVVYFSHSIGGSHDILIDGLTVDLSQNGIKSTIHFYHSESGAVNCWNVKIRNMHVTGGNEAGIYLWDHTIHDITIEDSSIAGAKRFAVRYEDPGSAIILRRVTSTASREFGFFSSLGANPPGITFDNVSLR